MLYHNSYFPLCHFTWNSGILIYFSCQKQDYHEPEKITRKNLTLSVDGFF